MIDPGSLKAESIGSPGRNDDAAYLERARQLFELSPSAIITSARNRLTDCNRAAVKLFGLADRDEIRRLTAAELSDPLQAGNLEFAAAARWILRACLRQGSTTFAWNCRRKDGTLFSAEITAAPLGDRHRHEYQFIVTDVTDRLEARVRVARHSKHLERLLEASPSAIMVIDSLTDQVSWANAQARALFGLEFDGAEDIPAPRLWVHSEDRRYFVQRYLSNGHASGEALLKNAAGEAFTAMLSWQPNLGNSREYVCWAVDLSGLHETRSRLQFHERMLEAIFEHLPIALFCKDIKDDFRYSRGNRMWVDLFGMNPESYVGKSDFDIYPLDQAQYFRSTDLKALEAGNLEMPEDSYVRADGERLIIRTVKAVIEDEDGEPELMLCMSEDITQSKEAERALRNSERRFRELAASAPVGIIVTDTQGLCLYVNEQWRKMTGLTEAEADGFGWQRALHKDDQRDVIGRWQAFVVGERPFSIEYRLQHPNGRVTWVAGRAVPFRNEVGQAVGFLGTATNITERKEFERRLQDSRDEADRANRAKSEFLSRMSHELRTPLNAILGFGQLLELESDNLTQFQSEAVSNILSGGEHLLNLIEDVLDLSRIESGHFSLTFQRLALEPVLKRSLSMVSVMADTAGIEISQPSGPLPDVIGDPHRLQQVLVNLLSNAIKYNREGGTVTVSIEQPASGVARIRVADTGIGIRVEDFEYIFEPFERTAAPAHLASGTGIGLSISRQIMSLMGGEIGFDSEFGFGSTFWIELPLAIPGDVEVAQADSEQGDDSVSALAGLKLLFVEDHVTSVSFMQEMIRRLPGCELRTALTLSDGIALARSFKPDVILMDLNLPGMDGRSALNLLRDDARTRHIPVIALSDSASRELVELSHAAGFAQFLAKPVNPSDTVASLANLCAKFSKSHKSI